MTLTEFPMPNTRWDGAIVIASGWHTDEEYGVLLLDSAPPFYRIASIDAITGATTSHAAFRNIVPATSFFDDTFGFWGG